jgi:hypothetical protein
MSLTAPFTPGATATLAVTTATDRVALGAGAGNGVSDVQILVTSAASASLAFIVFGTSGVTATTAGTPILSGSAQTFTVPAPATHVAAITGASTATLYFTVGRGV